MYLNSSWPIFKTIDQVAIVDFDALLPLKFI